MNNQEKISGVIFDMDGCLIDTESVYKIAWRKAFDKYAVEVSTKQIDSWVGKGWDIIEKEIHLLTKNEKLTAEVRQAREDIFFQMLSDGLVHFMPGALEILKFTRKEKLNVGLASSTFKDKGMKILEHFEMLDYFNYLVFGDEVAERKPAGDIYLKAIEKSGLEKNQLLVFEDSLVGCQAAQAADLQTVWVPEKMSHSKPEDTPETVIEIVSSMSKGQMVLQSKL